MATNFNVSSRQGFKLWGLSPWGPSLADPCLTLAWASQHKHKHKHKLVDIYLMKMELVDTAGSVHLEPPQTCAWSGGFKLAWPSCRCIGDAHFHNIYLTLDEIIHSISTFIVRNYLRPPPAKPEHVNRSPAALLLPDYFNNGALNKSANMSHVKFESLQLFSPNSAQYLGCWNVLRFTKFHINIYLPHVSIHTVTPVNIECVPNVTVCWRAAAPACSIGRHHLDSSTHN